ncbi:MAG: hypothetical protein IJC25_02120 [Clostridia bacterium]|nr:hypothetical protein [Clostridia bacterium]
MAKMFNRHPGFLAYRKRLREAMTFKLEQAVERSRADEVRGLARTVGIRTDEYDAPSQVHHSPKDAFMSGLLYANPVVFNALGVTLIIGAASSLNKAAVISLVACILLLAVNFLTATVYRHLNTLLRLPAYALTAALLLIPIGRFLTYQDPALASSLGIYLPLVGISGLVIVRAEGYAVGSRVTFALADAVGNGLGFAAVCMLVGALRELLGSGKLGGVTVFAGHSFPAAHLSFFTFLLLGVIAAIWQSTRLSRMRRTQTEELSQTQDDGEVQA